jgi:branched-chain amino acid transport system substrate-binding protein
MRDPVRATAQEGIQVTTRKRLLFRLLAMLAVFGLVAAACGDDDDAEDGSSEEGTEEETDGEDAEGLVIGQIGPETGGLAFLGPPQFEGFALAIEDINAAGGVLGADVTTVVGDEAGDAGRVREAANRLLGEGADAIVGAASSGMSQEIIQILSDEEIAQCSPSNTSPAFSDQENADFYYRTVPPDEAVAPIIADEIIADGHQRVAIAARADDYGNALGELIGSALEEAGAEVEVVTFDIEAPNFDDVVLSIGNYGPDAVVLVTFDEGAEIITRALEAGITADVMYGGDGIFFPGLAELVDPSNPNVVDGMKLIGASGGTDFNERLTERTEGNLIYGGQSYDCAIIIALAAEVAGSTDASDFASEISGVTRDGTVCTTFEECKGLIEEGEDIDYDGVSGPLDLDDVGDPTFGRYAIAQFQEGELVPLRDQDVDLSTLG